MILEVQDVSFSYKNKKILDTINLEFEKARMYAIIGKSGSGKTTLLSLMSGILKMQSGSIYKQRQKIESHRLTEYRKTNSIIFQSYNLISYLTPIQNVVLAMKIVNKQNKMIDIARNFLGKVGLNEQQMNQKCKHLSGGQQQRVAIARSLASDTDVIFADEPTGNLDGETGGSIIELLQTIAHKEEKCVICVTHDDALKEYADTVIGICDGKVIDIEYGGEEYEK